MGNHYKNPLSKNIVIHTQDMIDGMQNFMSRISTIQNCVQTVVAEIGNIADLCGQVPPRVKSGDLISSCSTAIAYLAKRNFLEYGENVTNTVDKLMYEAFLADQETAEEVLDALDDLAYVNKMIDELNEVLEFKSTTNDVNAVERYFNYVMYHDTEWIPEVMQLDGTSEEEKYLARKLANLNCTEETKWDQEKVNQLWEACEEIYFTYGLQIDPRYLLAIIIHENTGSFNTSSENKAADGQNGPEKDYALDLMKANDLVFGKTLGYIYYHDDFKEAVGNNANILASNSADVFSYVNWNTPIIKLKKDIVVPGEYATHSAWAEDVEDNYELLAFNNAGMVYDNYLCSLDAEIVNEIANGIEMPEYKFVAKMNGSNSDGDLNDTYTITVATGNE